MGCVVSFYSFIAEKRGSWKGGRALSVQIDNRSRGKGEEEQRGRDFFDVARESSQFVVVVGGLFGGCEVSGGASAFGGSHHHATRGRLWFLGLIDRVLLLDLCYHETKQVLWSSRCRFRVSETRRKYVRDHHHQNNIEKKREGRDVPMFSLCFAEHSRKEQPHDRAS